MYGLQIKGGAMDGLVRYKAKKLAKKTGCTLAWAEGYIEGEMHRRHGIALSPYQRVGIDEHAKGLRAGFFQQALSGEKVLTTLPTARRGQGNNRETR
jgi:hypothetical protein